MRLYSVYYMSVGSSTCFGCRHPSSGARTTVTTASGTGQPVLLPSALVVEWEHSVLILLASCQQTCMTRIIAVCTVKNS